LCGLCWQALKPQKSYGQHSVWPEALRVQLWEQERLPDGRRLARERRRGLRRAAERKD
jgi:hypothetical protein